MLETTLSSTFIPGINLKGTVAGANWLFLLPHLPLTRVVCFGVPPYATLASLANFSQEVNVISSTPPQMHAASTNGEWANLRWHASCAEVMADWGEHSVDLALLVGWRSGWQLSRDQWLLEQLRRLLKPEGFIHYEYYAPVDPVQKLSKTDNALFGPCRQAQFWLTPIRGEVSTMVPAHEHEIDNFFAERELHSPSLKVSSSLKQFSLLFRGPKAAAHYRHRTAGSRSSADSKRRTTLSGHVKSILARTGSVLLKAIDHSETALELRYLQSKFIRRTGVISGGTAAKIDDQPPRYLKTIASKDGVNLDQYAWGMVAPADYSSRKLLFFLFDRTMTRRDRSLQYIVKMVRDPVYNARLENEHRALTLLQKSQHLDLAAVPQVAFAGYHANLALVGETVVDGVPFRKLTTGDADCPYLHAAIHWLTDLGSATADSHTSVAQVANTLTMLLGQFLKIYRMSPEHQSFLIGQIDQIARSQRTRSVFQHGDPGLWNLLVTPMGKVAFLDWEAAEPSGMPLWDLLYFLRSYTVSAARTRGVRDALFAFKHQFLEDTPFRQIVATAIQHYCERIQLHEKLIQPLFYSCWLHRALKEANRLAPHRVEEGHYVNLLRLCIDQNEAVAATFQGGG